MTGMSTIVKTIASWIKILIFLFGVYIVLFGHLTPGGGFSGGVILAASYVLLMLAFGKEFAGRNLPLGAAAGLDSVGALLFVAIALAGFKLMPRSSRNTHSLGSTPTSSHAIS